MRDTALFAAGLVLFLGPSALAFTRARTELSGHSSISSLSFAANLFGYTALAIFVVVTSWKGAWQLPINPSVSETIGAILLTIGAALYLVARFQFHSFRKTWGLETRTLTTSGVYHFMRHPQSLAWGLLLAGIALVGKSGAALALTAAYILSCAFWLPLEEAALRRQFGSRYTQYWLGRPRCPPSHADSLCGFVRSDRSADGEAAFRLRAHAKVEHSDLPCD
ncbi:MAG: isoprenylcysteine carboxylmethyltransferase family protein [Chthoniobacterales bacterium]